MGTVMERGHLHFGSQAALNVQAGGAANPGSLLLEKLKAAVEPNRVRRVGLNLGSHLPGHGIAPQRQTEGYMPIESLNPGPAAVDQAGLGTIASTSAGETSQEDWLDLPDVGNVVQLAALPSFLAGEAHPELDPAADPDPGRAGS